MCSYIYIKIVCVRLSVIRVDTDNANVGEETHLGFSWRNLYGVKKVGTLSLYSFALRAPTGEYLWEYYGNIIY